MQEESRENKNAKRLNFLKGRQSRNPSQTNGGAKIQINSETAIPKLQNLAQKYIGATNPQGFLTDLRVALGIPDSQGASKYGVVTIPKDDGSILQASLRITNHQANAEQYIQHNANYEYNLSIVVKRKPRKNTFIPNDSVKLEEYVYYGTKMQEVENPLTQVVKGIISFLQSGEYKDTTGIAFKNQSPQPNTTENKQNINCNINMNKELIKLTESDLKQIVKESINKILKEEVLPSYYTDFGDNGEFVPHGEDMFPDDLLYIADKINKMAGGKLSVHVKNDGRIDIDKGPSLTLETLETIIKITKYLHLDNVQIGDRTVRWHLFDKSHQAQFDKSRKTQVGNKYFGINNSRSSTSFDNDQGRIPGRFVTKKPKVLNYNPYD